MSISGYYLDDIWKNPNSKEHKEIMEIARSKGYEQVYGHVFYGVHYDHFKIAADIWFARGYNEALSRCAKKFKDDPEKKAVVDALQGLQELKNQEEEAKK